MSEAPALPIWLTRHLPGTGGRIKVEYEDFQVEEIPLYAPCGQGEHTFFEIEKRGLPTLRAVEEIARALRVRPAQIGFAGLKDAHAVTRQVLSVEHVPPERVLALELPGIRVLWARRHTNKLKQGHLAGNRFVIRIRDVSENAAERAHPILEELRRRGVPNYFGEQRFGRRKDTHLLGRALLRGDAEAFLREFLGRPQPDELPAVLEARRLYDAGQLQAALRTWPPQFHEERRALEVLLRSPAAEAPQRAVHAISKRLRGFFVSAYQSFLFNRIMAERVDTLDILSAGDVAYKHDSGGAFLVEDPAVEQPRADRFEISPSGPLYGYRMLLAEGRQGELECRVLAEEGLTLEDFKRAEGLRLKGGRRPLRFPIKEVDMEYDNGLVLTFILPPGCYATNVLAEVMKVGPEGTGAAQEDWGQEPAEEEGEI
ncbi:MAG: tRNA pseudouridine(13) synthase TruD [Anaerolineae bacterium]